jgi:hypothetical protein
MALIGVCLALAASTAALAAPVFVPTTHFTLAWTHSIENVRWEEDYAVRADNLTPGAPHGPGASSAARPRLQALQARVRGSAAGMEPPPDARLHKGWYVYTPAIAYPTALPLMRSGFTADYSFCTPTACQPMSALLASDGGVTVLTACHAPTQR